MIFHLLLYGKCSLKQYNRMKWRLIKCFQTLINKMNITLPDLKLFILCHQDNIL